MQVGLGWLARDMLWCWEGFRLVAENLSLAAQSCPIQSFYWSLGPCWVVACRIHGGLAGVCVADTNVCLAQDVTECEIRRRCSSLVGWAHQGFVQKKQDCIWHATCPCCEIGGAAVWIQATAHASGVLCVDYVNVCMRCDFKHEGSLLSKGLVHFCLCEQAIWVTLVLPLSSAVVACKVTCTLSISWCRCS